jgi:hypothetical protein
VLPAVLAIALAGTGSPVRLELAADGGLTYTDITPTGPAASTIEEEDGLAGQVRLRVNVYPGRPLIDDDAPPALQPFLQRAFRLQAAGGYFGSDVTVESQDIEPTHQLAETGSFQIGAEGYPIDHLYGAASLLVQSSAFRIVRPAEFGGAGAISSTLSLSVSASLGARFGDVLVAGTWTVTPSQTDSAPWRVHQPTPGLSTQIVLHRRWSITAALIVLEGGAQASGGVDFFVNRALDVFASVNGGHSNPAGGAESDYAGARVGAFLWQSRWFGLGVTYAPQWTRFPGVNTITQVAHFVQLTVASRPR